MRKLRFLVLIFLFVFLFRIDYGLCGSVNLSQGEFFGFAGFAGGKLKTPVVSASSISAGRWHSLVLDLNGNVWAFGSNGSGELGTDEARDIMLGEVFMLGSRVPIRVKGPGGNGYLTDVVAISAGDSHSLALKSDGTVWAWGRNLYGELGNNKNESNYAGWPMENFPVQVLKLKLGGSGYEPLSGIVKISAGWYYSLALDSDGYVWAWGLNDSGQLGIGSHNNKKVATRINGLTGVVAISAGYSHSLALKSDGTVWAWGDNGDGQLGDGTTTSRTAPVRVGNLTDVIAISAGSWHSLALKSDGSIWAWGSNHYGELGTPTSQENKWGSKISSTPVRVKGPNGEGFMVASNIDGGEYYSVAIKSDGTVWMWGYFHENQSYYPWQVPGLRGQGYLSNIVKISVYSW